VSGCGGKMLTREGFYAIKGEIKTDEAEITVRPDPTESLA
jgi:hypothetical protein